jgi:hypothetical protein
MISEQAKLADEEWQHEIGFAISNFHTQNFLSRKNSDSTMSQENCANLVLGVTGWREWHSFYQAERGGIKRN